MLYVILCFLIGILIVFTLTIFDMSVMEKNKIYAGLQFPKKVLLILVRSKSEGTMNIVERYYKMHNNHKFET